MKYNTVVVGLGAAGVTAAITLAKAGKKVLALEADNRIGGRVKTVKFGDGFVEEGAEWIHGTENNCIYDAAIKNKIAVLSDDADMDIYRSDGSKHENFDVLDLMMFCMEARLEDPLPSDDRSLGDYIKTRLLEYLGEKYPHLRNDNVFISDFFEYMNLIINNYEAADDWGDVSVHSSFIQCGGDQSISWHKYGFKTYFDTLLNTSNNSPGLPNLEIKLNAEVKEIKWSEENRSNVEVITKDGSIFLTDNVIVTVSLGVLKERHSTLFNPMLPKDKISAINKISMGVMDKIILRFDKPWWPEHRPMYGFFWKAEDKNIIPPSDKWITKIFGATHPLGSTNTITLWTSGEVARLVEVLPEETVKIKLVELLRRFIGSHCDIPEPSEMIRSTWYSNPLTRGSYSYDNLLTPLYPNLRQHLEAPLLDRTGQPRVLFAGEATHPQSFSTVHGASDSGLREAKRLLSNSKI